MEQISDGTTPQANPGIGTTQRRKSADYIYQAATIAAVLLLLLTATV